MRSHTHMNCRCGLFRTYLSLLKRASSALNAWNSLATMFVKMAIVQHYPNMPL